MVKIKFCGFTRREDIEKAIELRIDYVGFILYPKSPRYVTWEKLRELVNIVESSAKKVAVMVNPLPQEVIRAFDLGVDLVQLHGEEDYEFTQLFDQKRIIKAFKSCPSVEISDNWKNCYALLLDACSSFYGGSGQLSDWNYAKSLVERGFKVFLAGGLKIENVAQAIREVKPYAVDVSSGIEESPGIKDHRKMEEFVHAVKNSS